MYANNRAGKAGRSIFRTAGGTIYLYSHPKLTGQIGSHAQPDGGVQTNPFDSAHTVDISSALRLNSTFFNARPAQPNAVQEPMVDGSVITITNHLMAGTATLEVVPGSGLVKDGDLAAIAALVVSSKDDVGGALTRIRFTSAGVMTRIYYGVSFADFPHEVDAGNAVAPYTITMLYSGWIEGVTKRSATPQTIWAVGNRHGVKGSFSPFTISGIGEVDKSNAKPGDRNNKIDSLNFEADDGGLADTTLNFAAVDGVQEGTEIVTGN